MADPPDGGFLPPQAPGPEPELGKAPSPRPPEPALPPHQPPQQQWPQQLAYPVEPDNGPAVTGFVLAMVSLGLWVFTAGLSTLVSLGLAIGGLFASRTGQRRVASGETRKHKGLAQAGFISSIVMIVLAVLSTIAWTAFFVLFATDESFRDGFDTDDDGGFDSNSFTTTVRLGVLLARCSAHLLS
jgi:hypothetical protein